MTTPVNPAATTAGVDLATRVNLNMMTFIETA
jgi:hypothetical protein